MLTPTFMIGIGIIGLAISLFIFLKTAIDMIQDINPAYPEQPEKINIGASKLNELENEALLSEDEE